MTTSSENYKDDAIYERYKEMHADVIDQERNFLKTIVHFQQTRL